MTVSIRVGGNLAVPCKNPQPFALSILLNICQSICLALNLKVVQMGHSLSYRFFFLVNQTGQTVGHQHPLTRPIRRQVSTL